MPDTGRASARLTPLTIAAIYVLAGVLWILFSDRLAAVLTDTSQAYEFLQTIKGWLFVFVSGGLIYLLVRRRLNSIRREVEKRERTARLLTDSEARYRNLFETMAQGVVYHDRDGRIVSANPAARRMLGITAAGEGRFELSGNRRTVREDGAEFPPDQHPAMIALRTGVEVRNMVMGLRDDESGETRWIQVNAVPTSGSGESGLSTVFATFEDITELKRMEQDIAGLAGALRAMIEASPLAIFDLDREGRVRSIWNPAAERIFGWKEQEVFGRPLPIVPPDRQHEFRALRDRVLAGDSFTGMELQRLRRDGAPVEISLATAPLRDPAGEVTGIMALAADITEEKKLEQQVIRSQKMEAVGRLAGGIAHDFNNLLTVIMGNTSLLTADEDLNPEQRQLAEEIAASAGRASQLTRRLLTFSRKQVTEHVAADLNSVLEELMPMLKRLARDNVEITCRLEPELWPVKADVGQVEQVLTNLAINAVDAMPDGGSMTLETGNVVIDREFGERWYELEQGDYVRLTVTDTGIGMTAETLDLIFEPFFSTKSPDKGTGLGLSTCYAIVRQHGGGIQAASEPGEGTTFTIFLPRAAEEPREKSAEAPEPADRLEGTETVLLVEDEDTVRITARRMLERHGYRVIDFAAGEDALAWASGGEARADLLVTDLVLPGMGGRELFRKTADMIPDLAVVYVSGYPDNRFLRGGLPEGTLYFLQKPFSQTALLREVRAALEESD